MQESVLGIPPKASVGKWDTGFAVGVGKGSGGGGGTERGGGGGVSWPGSQEYSKVLSF